MKRPAPPKNWQAVLLTAELFGHELRLLDFPAKPYTERARRRIWIGCCRCGASYIAETDRHDMIEISKLLLLVCRDGIRPGGYYWEEAFK